MVDIGHTARNVIIEQCQSMFTIAHETNTVRNNILFRPISSA
ncbi:hypothetical protein SAJA_06210 [Salinisphaera japonica YTM-1]|uniref:Uncharacterized protein n=1 Tax=Salinisphaera japonica YTM-1 TaxID=1209778 RepID=A0A423PVH9_9GAMM|nr:hypothetical protein SAJA_06210 [Salinisphaera japonica YTM-1]